MFDIHTHILPNIDDGSRSPGMSVEMIREEAAQGVRGIIMTPHFYADDDTPEDLWKRRSDASSLVAESLRSLHDLPPILLGAEVHFYQGMSRSESLRQLTIANTRYILVEMPFRTWHRGFVREVQDIGHNLGLQVILAHIERYFDQDKALVRELLEDPDILIQSNAEAFIERRTRRKVLKLLKAGQIDLLGSDCHNMTGRAPNLKEAEDIILKAKLGARLEDIDRRSIEIFRQAGADIRE